jgi:hypothetical protein
MLVMCLAVDRHGAVGHDPWVNDIKTMFTRTIGRGRVCDATNAIASSGAAMASRQIITLRSTMRRLINREHHLRRTGRLFL